MTQKKTKHAPAVAVEAPVVATPNTWSQDTVRAWDVEHRARKYQVVCSEQVAAEWFHDGMSDEDRHATARYLVHGGAGEVGIP